MVNTAMREGDYHAEINGEKVDLSKAINHLGRTIENSKLDENVSVYRGFSEKRYMDLEVGSTIEDKSFVSTTQNRSIAEDYFKPISGEHGTPDRKIFQMDLPKGHGALAVAPISKFPKEREVILNPQRFVVTKIENTPREGGTLTIYHVAPVKESHVVHEGLETEEQRAWWFWNLKSGGNYEGPGGKEKEGSKSKFGPAHPFTPISATGAAAVAANAATQPSTADLSAKIFNKPMGESSYKQISQYQTEKLTDLQRESIQNYTGSDYHDINGAMRTGKYESEWGGKYPDWRIKQIDNNIQLTKDSIDSNSLDKDVSVFRGFSDKRYSNLEVGATIEDKGFVSTSISRGTATNFYKPKPEEAGGPDKIFQINLPKGHPALAVGEISSAKSENEIVLNPQKFVVTGITTLKADKSTTYHKDIIVYHLSPTGNGKSK
jgi:hypothetical protein